MKRKVLIIILVFALLLMCVGTVSATSYKGYAIYRDKLWIVGLYGHAGVVEAADLSETALCIVHMTSDDDAVWCDLLDFMGYGQTFAQEEYRIARPDESMTTEDRIAVAATARELSAKHLTYILTHQIDYMASEFGNSILEVEDLVGMRCDGVVEYSYEYEGIRIYGNNSLWNIAVPSQNSLSHHSALNINPNKQCEEYMTLVYSGSIN